MFNPTTAQRVNERYRRLLINSGWVLPESGAELTLNYDFVAQPNLDSQINPATGAPAGPTLDITRTTTKNFTDWESVLRTVVAGEASFTGCRRVENLLKNSKLAGTVNPNTPPTEWTLAQTGGSITPGTATLVSTGDSIRIQAINARIFLRQDIATVIGATYRFSAYVEAIETVSVQSNLFVVGISGYIIQLADLGNRVSFTFTATATTHQMQVGVGTGSNNTGDFTVSGVQVENVSGQSDTSPSEYVDTTTVPAAQTFPLQKSGLPFPTTPLGLLPESAGTNICLQSEVLGTTWNQTNGTIGSNAGIAPDGTLTADKIIEGGSTTTHNLSQPITVVDSTQYTVSMHVKAAENGFAILFTGGAGLGSAGISVNLSTGAVSTATGSPLHAKSVSNGNGWYRVSFNIVAIDSASANLNIYNSEDGLWANRSYAGDSSSGILVWGVQLEVGVFPTSYIPTTTASVTRNADDILTNDMGWYNALEGSFYFAAQRPQLVDPAASFIYHASDGSSLNRIAFQLPTIDSLGAKMTVSSGGSTVAALTSLNTWGSSVLHRGAMSYALNDFEYYDNGDRTATGDQAGAVPVDVDVLHVGSNLPGFQYINGHIASLRYYNKGATQSELEDLTNGLLAP